MLCPQLKQLERTLGKLTLTVNLPANKHFLPLSGISCQHFHRQQQEL